MNDPERREAGRALDEEVARRVLGWTLADRKAMGWGDGPPVYLTGDEDAPTLQGFAPSTEIRHAWQIVEKMQDDDWLVVIKAMPQGIPFRLDLETETRPISRRVVVQLSDMRYERGESILARRHGPLTFADAAPLAICLAALSALDSEERLSVSAPVPPREEPTP